jgi:hypothetical protein
MPVGACVRNKDFSAQLAAHSESISTCGELYHDSSREGGRLPICPHCIRNAPSKPAYFDPFAGHEIGRELKAMSAWLDDQSAVIGRVAADLRQRGRKPTGRHGLPAELVLRCALLKQHRQLSYEELAFHLEDPALFRAFARLPLSWTPVVGPANLPDYGL